MPLELKSEAFEPRINLNVELPDDENDMENGFEINGSEQQSLNNTTAAINEDNNNIFTVIVEDQTSALLCHDLEQAMWDPKGIIKDTLVYYAECGDVQTAVSMYMVLRYRVAHTNLTILCY